MESLGQLMRYVSSKDIPAMTGVWGRCDDGLPLLTFLNGQSDDSFLVVGTFEQGVTDLVSVFLKSVSAKNLPDRFKFHVATDTPWKYGHLKSLRHCQGIGDLNSIDEMYLTYAKRAFAKRRGRDVLVFVVDPLDGLDRETQARMRAIVEAGARYGVWVIGVSQKPVESHHFKHTFTAVNYGEFLFEQAGKKHRLFVPVHRS